MNLKAVWNRIRARRAHLRFALRVTVAAVLPFALAQLLAIPLNGLWAVLTAVVVIQMSAGASIRATADYVVGTLGGVIYASVLAVLVPHSDAIALAGLLALTMAPLAFAAALNSSFRVAPFTGALVLLISGQLGESPIDAALYRLIEVALGGGIAVAASLLVLPERAHGLRLDAGASILDQFARALPRLLTGFSQRLDVDEVRRMHEEISLTLAGFQAHAVESKGERLFSLVARPDPGPLQRTMLRLRHDLIMVGRVAEPLPGDLAPRLHPPLERIAASAGAYLHGCAVALAARRSPPSREPLKAALEAYTSEIAAFRKEGAMRSLSSGELERLFALGFALEQLQQNFSDLERCIEEHAHES